MTRSAVLIGTSPPAHDRLMLYVRHLFLLLTISYHRYRYKCNLGMQQIIDKNTAHLTLQCPQTLLRDVRNNVIPTTHQRTRLALQDYGSSRPQCINILTALHIILIVSYFVVSDEKSEFQLEISNKLGIYLPF